MVKKGKKQKVTLVTVSKKIDDLAVSTAKSIEDLAIITKKGFDNTVSKEEFTEFKTEMTEFKKGTETTLFNLDGHAKKTNERLDAIEKAMGPLVQVSGFMQKEIRELNMRVNRLEHKVGISPR